MLNMLIIYCVKATDPEMKIRVVFSTFFRTVSGITNDMLLPKLQRSMASALALKNIPVHVFNRYYEELSAIHQKNANLQRILQRMAGGGTIEEMRDFLPLTITYDTTSASYLAICILHQLVEKY